MLTNTFPSWQNWIVIQCLAITLAIVSYPQESVDLFHLYFYLTLIVTICNSLSLMLLVLDATRFSGVKEPYIVKELIIFWIKYSILTIHAQGLAIWVALYLWASAPWPALIPQESWLELWGWAFVTTLSIIPLTAKGLGIFVPIAILVAGVRRFFYTFIYK